MKRIHHGSDYDDAIPDLDQALQLDPKLPEAYIVRGLVHGAQGNYDQAIADDNLALQIDPKNAYACVLRATAEATMGNGDKAITDFKQALELGPDNAEIYNAYAWSLATCPQASCRNGKKAVEYATKACGLTAGQEPNDLDTLAAACAESGDFASAVKWETHCLETPYLRPDLTSAAQKRLALYRAHQPYHEAQ